MDTTKLIDLIPRGILLLRSIRRSPGEQASAITSNSFSIDASTQLSVPVIIAIASSCLVDRDTLRDINPAFESDANIVPVPPEQSAFSDCEKVVERDVEMYRKKAQSICMHLGVRSANVISYNAQFSPTIKEQQAIRRMFDHRQSNP